MSFEEFQDGYQGGHLRYRNGMFQQFCISMLPKCLLLSFSSIQLMVLEEMSKMWKANDRQTDDRPLHKLTWSKATGELMIRSGQVLNSSKIPGRSNANWMIYADDKVRGCFSKQGAVTLKINYKEEMSKMWKANDGQTDDRPLHKLTWSKATGELMIRSGQVLNSSKIPGRSNANWMIYADDKVRGCFSKQGAATLKINYKILPLLELIHDLIHVPFTCKIQEYLIKSEWVRLMTKRCFFIKGDVTPSLNYPIRKVFKLVLDVPLSASFKMIWSKLNQ